MNSVSVTSNAGPPGHMSLLQLGIELFLIAQKIFSYLMLLRESLPHALCLWVPESSRASVLQGCGHMVISEVFALIILGCEALRRSPRISGQSRAHRPQGRAAGISGLFTQLFILCPSAAGGGAALLHKYTQSSGPQPS